MYIRIYYYYMAHYVHYNYINTLCGYYALGGSWECEGHEVSVIARLFEFASQLHQ